MYSPYSYVRLAVLGILVTTAAPVYAIGITPPSWKPRELVASAIASSTFHEGADRVLAYDNHGNPGIAFYDNVDDSLRYARFVPGFGWNHQTVDGGFGFDTGQYPSLAYDRYERPAISYFDFNPNSDLKFAHFDGTAWNIETVDSVGEVGSFSSLTFDLLGRAAIAYRDINNVSLEYVIDSDGDFSFLDETPVTVTSGIDEGFYPTLAFDPLNRPMIAHQHSGNKDLRFSVEEPGLGWLTRSVDTTGNTGNHPSLDIDPDTGFPAIAYFDEDTDNLRYAAWDGGAWVLTTVNPGGGEGRFPSLAFDPADGNPAIAYQGNSFLKLAWHDGSAWQTQIVEQANPAQGTVTSLAFNEFGHGFPSIAYINPIDGNWYFSEDPPAAVPEPVSILLLAIGAGALSVRRRNRRA